MSVTNIKQFQLFIYFEYHWGAQIQYPTSSSCLYLF